MVKKDNNKFLWITQNRNYLYLYDIRKRQSELLLQHLKNYYVNIYRFRRRLENSFEESCKKKEFRREITRSFLKYIKIKHKLGRNRRTILRNDFKFFFERFKTGFVKSATKYPNVITFNKNKRVGMKRYRRKKKRFLKRRKGKKGRKIKVRLTFHQMRIKRNRKFLGPIWATEPLGEAISYFFKEKKKNKLTNKTVIVSSKINVNLFKINYNILLSYHVPFGKKVGEGKPNVQITNIILFRNKMAILNIITVFLQLRKAVNRVFKAMKLRNGIALLNGRSYSWRRRFTFVLDKWLPGLFTNFWLNINELLSYFYKKRCLTRRQRTRGNSLKMMNLDSRFFRRVTLRKRAINLLRFTKLPTVSISLIDNNCWMRECLKEGISTIQLTDQASDIEKIEYPIVSNQSSIPFLSFISMLFKEVNYQARSWEVKNLKKLIYYKVMDSKKKHYSYSIGVLATRWLKSFNRYKRRIRRKMLKRKRLNKKKILRNWEEDLLTFSNFYVRSHYRELNAKRRKKNSNYIRLKKKMAPFLKNKKKLLYIIKKKQNKKRRNEKTKQK